MSHREVDHLAEAEAAASDMLESCAEATLCDTREKVGFIENTAMRHRWGG